MKNYSLMGLHFLRWYISTFPVWTHIIHIHRCSALKVLKIFDTVWHYVLLISVKVNLIYDCHVDNLSTTKFQIKLDHHRIHIFLLKKSGQWEVPIRKCWQSIKISTNDKLLLELHHKSLGWNPLGAIWKARVNNEMDFEAWDFFFNFYLTESAKKER